VKHFVEDHTYEQRAMWKVEWMVGEELLDDQTELRCMLGDNTKVRKHKWWELKDEAMSDYYTELIWFKLLNSADKKLLTELQAA